MPGFVPWSQQNSWIHLTIRFTCSINLHVLPISRWKNNVRIKNHIKGACACFRFAHVITGCARISGRFTCTSGLLTRHTRPRRSAFYLFIPENDDVDYQKHVRTCFENLWKRHFSFPFFEKKVSLVSLSLPLFHFTDRQQILLFFSFSVFFLLFFRVSKKKGKLYVVMITFKKSVWCWIHLSRGKI